MHGRTHARTDACGWRWRKSSSEREQLGKEKMSKNHTALGRGAQSHVAYSREPSEEHIVIPSSVPCERRARCTPRWYRGLHTSSVAQPSLPGYSPAQRVTPRILTCAAHGSQATHLHGRRSAMCCRQLCHRLCAVCPARPDIEGAEQTPALGVRRALQTLQSLGSWLRHIH